MYISFHPNTYMNEIEWDGSFSFIEVNTSYFPASLERWCMDKIPNNSSILLENE